jgi:hypothetical protein
LGSNPDSTLVFLACPDFPLGIFISPQIEMATAWCQGKGPGDGQESGAKTGRKGCLLSMRQPLLSPPSSPVPLWFDFRPPTLPHSHLSHVATGNKAGTRGKRSQIPATETSLLMDGTI